MDWIEKFIDDLEKQKAEAEEQNAHLGVDLFTREKKPGTDWSDTTEQNKKYLENRIVHLQSQIDRLKEKL